MKLPYEILREIGLYLNQINQKECCLVCKAWKNPFQTLVFQKVVLLEQRQADLYVQQSPSLRKLTTALHFNISLTDEQFKQYAQASPKVNTLTLFINLLNILSIPKTVSVIKTYWLKNLVKIRMDDLILPEILPLISHQAEDVTGGFEALFDKKTGKLMPMPKLKILDVEQEEEEIPMTARVLNDMRIAYPKLQDLTLSYFYLEPIDDEDTFVFTPFPFVRSFHMLNCNDKLDSYPQMKRMFTDLRRFSFLRTDLNDKAKWAHAPYRELVTKNPNLKELNLLYLSGMSERDGFPDLNKLSKLTSLHLERSIGTDIITKRVLFNFDLLLASVPQLKRLKLYGLFHLSTKCEPFDHYLSGTVGFCDTTTNASNFIRTGENVRSHVQYEEENESDDFTSFGNGEQLYQGKDLILTVKKKMPQPLVESSNLYEWYENKPFLERLSDLPSLSLHAHPLTNLHIECATLKNSTYRWISHHLPLLEEFYVLQTEPYPFCKILLGKNVRTFKITFDSRYTKYPTPVVQLTTNDYERVLEWGEEENGFRNINAKKQPQFESLYMINILYHPSLVDLAVCNHSLSPILKDIKDK